MNTATLIEVALAIVGMIIVLAWLLVGIATLVALVRQSADNERIARDDGSRDLDELDARREFY